MPANISALLNAETPPRQTLELEPEDLRGPGAEGEDDLQLDTPRSSTSPAPPSQGEKRPLEDYTDIARKVARTASLKPNSENERAVIQFANAPQTVQLIVMYARLRSVSARLDEIAIPDAIFEIPTVLSYRIECTSLFLLMSPSCALYAKPGPLALVLEHLVNNPNWGLTPAVKNDKLKYDVVVKGVQKALTSRRNNLKSESLGFVGKKTDCEKWNILTLAKAILALGESLNDGGAANASLPVLARFAFLRSVTAEGLADPTSPFAGKEFWPTVDTTLRKICEVKKTDERISFFFATVLEEDIEAYGEIDRTKLAVPGFKGLDAV
ncbi:hypothetical protein BKA70DRAFT_1505035 [Coprinopsis sp. MPI-PUGE-AT-0042]|nr:hypothetical protein BKA70DRAFT_1505035 [Coprinopsis sp. MPI-PUGE-AT-0042]